jgi:putative (di)nucleoside polyphosphate hydrolase
MIDSDGYRPNVGIILCNDEGHLLWAKRIGQDAWQFPQGGIRSHETPEEALYRELKEEIGLDSHHVTILGHTRDWLHYDLPKRFVRHGTQPVCIGQKQVWFLLRLLGTNEDVKLDLGKIPEFDGWRWVDYWYPIDEVVSFKQEVYRNALEELAPLIQAPLAKQPHSAHS